MVSANSTYKARCIDKLCAWDGMRDATQNDAVKAASAHEEATKHNTEVSLDQIVSQDRIVSPAILTEPGISGNDPEFTREELMLYVQEADREADGMTPEQITKSIGDCRKLIQRERIKYSRYHLARERMKEKMSKEELSYLNKLDRSYRPAKIVDVATGKVSAKPRMSKEERTVASMAKALGKSVEQVKAMLDKM